MGIGLNLIEKYVWRTILPYFFLSWLLLTVVILLQQSSRYTEIFFGVNVPASLAFELMLGLLPNILAFTSPMALLTGILIGFGQLHGDSELIAARSAGVSTLKLLKPIFLLGFLLTVFTLYINFVGVPLAARTARQVAVKAALFKLESPLEPGAFSTDIPNYLVYAREGNLEKGVWEKVFIYNREKNGIVRLITAGSGKIDSAQDKSELVLSDARVTTLNSGSEITSEKVGALRIALETGRRQLLQRLQSFARTPEEMGLVELAEFARQKQGKERLEAEVLWHRRVSLALAPLVFALLGGALSLRFARGGRGLNGIIALVSIVIYYLFSLLAEQTVRSGRLEAAVGNWLPTCGALILSFWWLRQSSKLKSTLLPKFNFKQFLGRRRKIFENQKFSFLNSLRVNFVGLLERDFLNDLLRYFFFAIGSLLFLYLIFTTFELWRFVISARDGYSILIRYLLFLAPIVVFQLAPTALLLTIIATYAVKSKRGETIAWGAAGQNFYRLLLPAIVIAGAVGWVSWELQERILPIANVRQDALRSQLRGGGASISREGTVWFAAADKIYSFTNNPSATANSNETSLRNVQIYQFAGDGVHLERVVWSQTGAWSDGKLSLTAPEEISWQKSFVNINKNVETHSQTVADNFSPYLQNQSKFLYLSIEDIKERLINVSAVSEERRFSVSLQKHYAVFLQPLIVVLFCAPLAISFGRRSNAKAGALPIVYAFGLWLIFIGGTSVFDQFGYMGILPPVLAVWAPLAIMGSFGGYLIAKIRN